MAIPSQSEGDTLARGKNEGTGPDPMLIEVKRNAGTKNLEKISAILLVVVVIGVYYPVLTELARDWVRDPNYSHGLLLPIISAYLLWRKRTTLASLPPRPVNFLGFLGVLVACGVLVLGVAGSEVFTQRVSLILFLASGILFLFGWQWLRTTAFPLGFLLLAIPLPYVLYYTLTSPLQAFSAKVAIVGLQAFGVPVVAQGNILHLPDTVLEVAEACSGIRSLYSFLALGALLAYFMNIPLLGKVLVFVATIPLSVAANAFRVWATSLGAYLIGPQVATGTVHELFGILVFALALGMFFLVRWGVKRLWHSGSSS